MVFDLRTFLKLKFEFCIFSLGPEAVVVDEIDTTEEDPESCFFLNSPEIQSNLTMKFALGEKCLKIKSPKFVFGYGARAISIDDRKCGTKNATSIEMIEVSKLCYSQANNKLSKDFFLLLQSFL